MVHQPLVPGARALQLLLNDMPPIRGERGRQWQRPPKRHHQTTGDARQKIVRKLQPEQGRSRHVPRRRRDSRRHAHRGTAALASGRRWRRPQRRRRWSQLAATGAVELGGVVDGGEGAGGRREVLARRLSLLISIVGRCWRKLGLGGNGTTAVARRKAVAFVGRASGREFVGWFLPWFNRHVGVVLQRRMAVATHVFAFVFRVFGKRMGGLCQGWFATVVLRSEPTTAVL